LIVLLIVATMVVSAAIHHANRLVRATSPARRIRSMDRLHRSHLPFQTIVAAVVGAIGRSATDPSNDDQSRKAERELVHIELPMMNRRVGWRAVDRTVWALCQQCLRAVFRERTSTIKTKRLTYTKGAGNHGLPVHCEKRPKPNALRRAPLDNFCSVATLRFERNANARDIGVVVQNIDFA